MTRTQRTFARVSVLLALLAHAGSVFPANLVTPGAEPAVRGELNPEKDLKLVITRPHFRDADARAEAWQRPLIQMKVVNVSDRSWYFSRDARGFGIVLIVTDSQGTRVELNPDGKELSDNALTSRERRTVDSVPGHEEEFLLALGEYMRLKDGKRYKVQIKWTIHMHPTAAARFPLTRAPGLSPTLVSNVIELEL